MTLGYFALGVITATLGRMIYEIIKATVMRRREKKFFRFVEVSFPNHSRIRFGSAASSDPKAISEIQKQIEAFQFPTVPNATFDWTEPWPTIRDPGKPQ